MIPWSVMVQQTEGGNIEVAVVDPVASMQAVDNKELGKIGGEVRDRLKKLLDML